MNGSDEALIVAHRVHILEANGDPPPADRFREANHRLKQSRSSNRTSKS